MNTSANNESAFSKFTLPIKNLIFGQQNERLEFLMDSYFKLSPEARTATIVGSVLFGIVFVLGSVGLYIAAIDGLQQRLNDAFYSASSLRDVQDQYNLAKQKMATYEQRVAAASQDLVLLSFLENKSRDLGLTASNFPAQLPTIDFPSTNPLSKKYQIAKVEFNVNNASIKKIVDLIISIEASPHMLYISGLKIRGQFGNKLYFNASIEVEGTVTKKQN